MKGSVRAALGDIRSDRFRESSECDLCLLCTFLHVPRMPVEM